MTANQSDNPVDVSLVGSTVDTDRLREKTRNFIASLEVDGKPTLGKLVLLPPNERADEREQQKLTSFVATVNGATPLAEGNPLITPKIGSGISWWRVSAADDGPIDEIQSVDVFSSDEAKAALDLWNTAPGISAVMLTAGRDEDTLERFHLLVVQGNDREAAETLCTTLDQAAEKGESISLHAATKLPEYTAAMRKSQQLRQRIAERTAETHQLKLVSAKPIGNNETHAVRYNSHLSSKLASVDEAERSTYVVYNEAVDPSSSFAGAMMFRGERNGYTLFSANEKADANGNPSRSWTNASRELPFSYFPAHPGSYLHSGSATIRPSTHATNKRLRWIGPITSYNPLAESGYNNHNAQWLAVQSALGAEPGSADVHAQQLALVWAEVPAFNARGLDLPQLIEVSKRCSEASFPVPTNSPIVHQIIDKWADIRSAGKKSLAEVFADESADGKEVHLNSTIFQLLAEQ